MKRRQAGLDLLVCALAYDPSHPGGGNGECEGSEAGSGDCPTHEKGSSNVSRELVRVGSKPVEEPDFSVR